MIGVTVPNQPLPSFTHISRWWFVIIYPYKSAVHGVDLPIKIGEAHGLTTSQQISSSNFQLWFIAGYLQVIKRRMPENVLHDE